MADNAEKSPIGSNTLGSSDGVSVENIIVDKVAERSYGKTNIIRYYATYLTDLSAVKKLDFYLLPFLSLMYFFNSVDRVSFLKTKMQSCLNGIMSNRGSRAIWEMRRLMVLATILASSETSIHY